VIAQEQREAFMQSRLNRALFSQAITCFALFDPEGQIIQVNESYANYYGKKAVDLVGSSIYENNSADMDISAAKMLVMEVVRSRKALNFENYPYQFPSQPERGTTYWDSTVQPILDETGKVEFVFFSSIDVTKRRRAEMELIRAKDEAENASRMKSKFLDIAAHELRTPVAAFSSLLQLSEVLLLKGQPVTLETVSRLRRQAERLANLVGDLMEVSRLEHDAMSLHLKSVDIGVLIAGCIDDFKLQNPSRRILLSKPMHSVSSELDPVRINQTLSNLIENAIRYTPEATPIEVTIEEKNDDWVRINVTDHGPGIPKEQQRELFEAFTRGCTGREVQTEGLGLGLFICRRIVELHRGSIGLLSEPGVGSTFYFELPRIMKFPNGH